MMHSTNNNYLIIIIYATMWNNITLYIISCNMYILGMYIA